MRKVVELTPNDFPGVDPVKFQEFIQEVPRFRRNIILVTGIWTILIFLLGNWVPASFSDGYVLIMFGIVLLGVRLVTMKLGRLMKEMGITFKMVSEAQKR